MLLKHNQEVLWGDNQEKGKIVRICNNLYLAQDNRDYDGATIPEEDKKPYKYSWCINSYANNLDEEDEKELIRRFSITILINKNGNYINKGREFNFKQ